MIGRAVPSNRSGDTVANPARAKQRVISRWNQFSPDMPETSTTPACGPALAGRAT